MMCSAGYAQSTFTFGSAPRQYQQYPNQYQQYPNQYQQYPPQYYPQQQRGIPIGQGGSGSGGIPIGALIPLAMMLGNAVANSGSSDGGRHLNGCANGHLNVSQCAWCQRQMQLMRQEQQQQQQPQRRSVDADIHNMDTAAGANAMIRAPLPEGQRISAHVVKSPYSDYVFTNAIVQPGHIVTDHSIVPKKNFLIPKQALVQED